MKVKKTFWFLIILIIGIASTIFFIGMSENLTAFQLTEFHCYNIEGDIIGRIYWSKSKNAVSYRVSVYDKKDEKVFEDTTETTQYDIPDLGLQINEEFIVEVVAIDKNKKERRATSLYEEIIWDEAIPKVADLNANIKSGKIEGRKSLVLTTSTKKSKIYYTTDGTDPTIEDKEYQDPIPIKGTMNIKAIAIKDDMEPSDILELNYQQISNKPIIYLSPSTQGDNIGVTSVGYTTEKEMMNKIGDVVEKQLKENGVTVHRNEKNKNAKEAISDSRKYDSDFHIAIHSNASPDYMKGKNRGIQTWVFDHTSILARIMGQKIQDALVAIYYRDDGDQGVLNSIDIGGLGETNPDYVNNGILIEVAFHDNKDDAKWIVENIEEIGTAITKAILSYYEEW